MKLTWEDWDLSAATLIFTMGLLIGGAYFSDAPWTALESGSAFAVFVVAFVTLLREKLRGRATRNEARRKYVFLALALEGQIDSWLNPRNSVDKVGLEWWLQLQGANIGVHFDRAEARLERMADQIEHLTPKERLRFATLQLRFSRAAGIMNNFVVQRDGVQLAEAIEELTHMSAELAGPKAIVSTDYRDVLA